MKLTPIQWELLEARFEANRFDRNAPSFDTLWKLSRLIGRDVDSISKWWDERKIRETKDFEDRLESLERLMSRTTGRRKGEGTTRKRKQESDYGHTTRQSLEIK